MTEDHSFHAEPDRDGGDPHSRWRKLMAGIKIFAGLCVAGIAVAIAVYWLMNRPRAGREEPEERARIVEVTEVTSGTQQITVDAMGTVVPADEVGLVARVNGRITKVNPDLVPGSHLEEGEVLARVDQSDYKLARQQARSSFKQAKLTCKERKLAIRQRRNEVAQARKNLTLEQAQQEVARGEYELLVNGKGEMKDSVALTNPLSEASQSLAEVGNPGYPGARGNISEEEKGLILRKPQIKAARAALEAARAGKKSAEVAYENALEAREKAKVSLEQAKLDFERTTIEVPFDAVVQSEQVGVGTYVSSGYALANLVNTELYRVEVSVPVGQLQWLQTPTGTVKEGPKARIYHRSAWGEGNYRVGQVKRLKPGIEEEGRMARGVIEVKDPRCLKQQNAGKPVLLLDSFVKVRIAGDELQNAVRLPREALRNGARVWIMSPDDTLEIRPVTIKARAPDHVYVTKGLSSGDRLITSDIPTPVEGMRLERASASDGSVRSVE